MHFHPLGCFFPISTKIKAFHKDKPKKNILILR